MQKDKKSKMQLQNDKSLLSTVTLHSVDYTPQWKGRGCQKAQSQNATGDESCAVCKSHSRLSHTYVSKRMEKNTPYTVTRGAEMALLLSDEINS